MNSESLMPGAILRGTTEYKIEEKLHQGGFGITYRASGTYMAGNIPQVGTFTIKEFFISDICSRDSNGNVIPAAGHQNIYDKAKLDFRHEADMLHNLHHEGIVPVNEVFEQNNTVYYVMSFLGNVSLYQYVSGRGGKLSEPEAKSIIESVARAVNHLHNNNILHLDIKPDNIMMVQSGGLYKPVLIDFGQSLYFIGGKVQTPKKVGGYSVGYSALELKQGCVNTFQKDLDVYSVAATMLYMLTGIDPCDASEQGRRKIFQVLPESVSEQCADALVHAMATTQGERTKNVNDFICELTSGRAQSSASTGNAGTSGGRATQVIPPGTTSPSGSGFPMKYIYIAIAAMCLVIVVIFGMKMIGSCSHNTTDADKERISQDSLKQKIAAQIDSVKKAKENAETGSQTDSHYGSGNDVTNNSNDNPSGSSASAPDKQSAQPTSGTIDLGYGTWTGGLKNGKPDGNGTLVYSTEHRVDTRDETETYASAGDKMKGSFHNGHWEYGSLFSSSGSKKATLMIGN